MLKKSYSKDLIEVGCDEAGRGCLAGPVVAAAVMFPKHYSNNLLNDSKKTTLKKRQLLYNDIITNAHAYGIGVVNNVIIDKINIANASFLAMHKAIDKIKNNIDLILIDGHRFLKYQNISYKCIIKGDGKYQSIAAASIIAKVYRDNLMLSLHKKHSKYGWKKNKGYPTKEHRFAIIKYGTSIYHRQTFKVTEKQLSLNFKS